MKSICILPLVKENKIQTILRDVPASIVVFLVALPLCLGIALASNAPLFSGLIAGIVGGLVVGSISGSPLSVSGPAAGLTVIVADAIGVFQQVAPDANAAWSMFLLSIVVAGVLQILFGALRVGILGYYFPNAVIHGMLAAIGLILILKQLPHLVGYDMDFEGDLSFLQKDGHNTFSELYYAWKALHPGAAMIGTMGLVIIYLWERPFLKKMMFFKLVPASLVVVFLGVVVNQLFGVAGSSLHVGIKHLVSLPVFEAPGDLVAALAFPDFSAVVRKEVWVVGVTIAVVASIESLLSVEAADRLDPLKRLTPFNRELVAQGSGNLVSALLGGLPLTAVIVRTSANVNAGARTKLSTILHGVWLLLAVLLLAPILNLIPLAALAAVLIHVGYKLTKPALYLSTLKKGSQQFIPFFATVLGIMFTDLLRGIGIGMVFGLVFILRNNYRNCITVVRDGNDILLQLKKDVFFLNKPIVRDALASIPEGTNVIIDGTIPQFIDQDIIDIMEDFIATASEKNITVELKKSYSSKYPLFSLQPEQGAKF